MGKKIFIVDDDQDIRNTIKTMLEANGYEVLTAVDGDDLLKHLDKGHVDLILLDIMMPGTPVREIIKKIIDIKIAFLTVVRTSEAERENLIRQKNIVDFIQKPFDIDELLKKVKTLLK